MHSKPRRQRDPKRPVDHLKRWVLAFALLLVSLTWTSGLANPQVSLGEYGFDWTTVEQERANFHWSAIVVNDSAQKFTVEVTIELLDDDDAVVATDSTSTTIDGNTQRKVEHESSLSFERAADVVSSRFRLQSLPPEGR